MEEKSLVLGHTGARVRANIQTPLWLDSELCLYILPREVYSNLPSALRATANIPIRQIGEFVDSCFLPWG